MWKRLNVRTAGKARRERTFWLEGCTPLFFVSVAFKGLSHAVSLLFATLAGRSIGVAAKGLKGRGGSPDRVPDRVGAGGISAPCLYWISDVRWTVFSREKNKRLKLERGRQTNRGKAGRARMGCDIHGRE